MLTEVKTDIYRLLHPKMAFFLTCIGRDGKPNVMACAWATPVSEEPPLVLVCIGKESYTASLIKSTREFVINIPRKEMLKRLWVCGKTSGRDGDKFSRARLERAAARKVKTPIVDGCIGYLECRLWKTVDAGECHAFFGRVVSAYADNAYRKNGLWRTSSEIPLHLGGSSMVYFTT